MVLKENQIFFRPLGPYYHFIYYGNPIPEQSTGKHSRKHSRDYLDSDSDQPDKPDEKKRKTNKIRRNKHLALKEVGSLILIYSICVLDIE